MRRPGPLGAAAPEVEKYSLRPHVLSIGTNWRRVGSFTTPPVALALKTLRRTYLPMSQEAEQAQNIIRMLTQTEKSLLTSI